MEKKMKKWKVASAIASMTLAGLFGCSSESTDVTSPTSISEKTEQSEGVVLVNAKDAKTHLAMYRRSVVDFRQFEGQVSEDTEGASIDIDSVLQGENFAIDADVTVEDDSVYTIASAGVDGDAFAWIIQIEKGAIVYSWRENGNSEWQVFKTNMVLSRDILNNIRVERADDMVVVSLNGSIKAAFRDGVKGSITLKGKFTIGFDKKDKDKCHCHNGHVDQIGVESVDEMEEGSEMGDVVDTDTTEAIDDVVDSTEVVDTTAELPVTEWIADWNFENAENLGLDATGNGHDAVIGEGSVAGENGIASFDGRSGFTIALDSLIKINEFVVEARVKPTKFGTMQNIIVAEPPGRGVDGWQLRIDEGVLTVHLRDTDIDADDWSIFPGKAMTLDQWCEIRLERSIDSVKLFQDGELTVAAAYHGDLTQMRYDWSIGFDGMDQAFHDRYFIGEMDFVRFGKFEGFSSGTVVPVKERLIAAWEFNEPQFIGLDRMANNSTHYLAGTPRIADTTVSLDGNSGLRVNLSKAFLRNTFAVEARVKPASFSAMQNIVVAEPPGRYGDGWIVRVDNGVLTVHFRDADTDGTEWNVYTGAELALGEWNEIRVERSADSIKVFQNGELTVNAVATGDISQLGYDIGIGYDAMNQAKHDRFFDGEIDYVRYYGL